MGVSGTETIKEHGVGGETRDRLVKRYIFTAYPVLPQKNSNSLLFSVAFSHYATYRHEKEIVFTLLSSEHYWSKRGTTGLYLQYCLYSE